MKPWYLSKTIWVQLITLALAVLATLGDQQIVVDHPQITTALVGVVAVLNMALRFISVIPLSLKKE